MSVSKKVIELLSKGKQEKAEMLAHAHSEVLANRWPCPECNSTKEKEDNGESFCCTECGSHFSTDVTPLEVTVEGFTFRIK